METSMDRAVIQMQRELIENARRSFSPQVIEHWLHPRNPGVLTDPDGEAWMKGACGDTLGVFLRIDDDVVVEASFVTDGCGASIAAGSAVVSLVEGVLVAKARMITAGRIDEVLGGLPDDHAHCADLASETLRAALKNYDTRRPAGQTGACR